MSHRMGQCGLRCYLCWHLGHTKVNDHIEEESHSKGMSSKHEFKMQDTPWANYYITTSLMRESMIKA